MLLLPTSGRKIFENFLFGFLFLLSMSSVSNGLSCLPCCSSIPEQLVSPRFDFDGDQIVVVNDTEAYVEPLHCTECDKAPEYCPSGQLTKGICGCCDVCAKAEGEECGGPWQMAGTCADYLFCEVDSDAEPFIELVGTCVLKGEECCATKIDVSSQATYELDRERNEYCIYNCAYRKKEDNGGLSKSLYCFMKHDKDVVCQDMN